MGIRIKAAIQVRVTPAYPHVSRFRARFKVRKGGTGREICRFGASILVNYRGARRGNALPR